MVLGSKIGSLFACHQIVSIFFYSCFFFISFRFFIHLTNQTQFQNMTGSSVHILYSKLYIFSFMHVSTYLLSYIVWNNRITTRSNKWRAKVYRFFFKNSKSKYAFVSNIKTYTEGNDYVLDEMYGLFGKLASNLII